VFVTNARTRTHTHARARYSQARRNNSRRPDELFSGGEPTAVAL